MEYEFRDDNFYIVFGWMNKELKELAPTYAAIYARSQDERQPFSCGREYLAQALNVNVRTIGRHIDELEKLGYIRVQRNVDGKGHKTNDTYFVLKQNPKGQFVQTLEDNLSKPQRTICPDNSNIYNNILLDSIYNARESFEIFRKAYNGNKRGLETEFGNLKKKHKDYEEVCKHILQDYQRQEEIKEKRRAAGLFVALPKNLQTYINQRCWEEEILTPEEELRRNGNTTISYGNSGAINRERQHLDDIATAIAAGIRME